MRSTGGRPDNMTNSTESALGITTRDRSAPGQAPEVAQSSDTPGKGRSGATGSERLDLQVVPGPAWEPPEPQHGSKTQRQLAVAFHSGPIGMAVTTDTAAFVGVNAALADLLGCLVSALLRPLEDLAAPGAALAHRRP